MKFIKSVSFLLLVTFAFFSCEMEEDFDLSTHHPKCEIVEQSALITTEEGEPYIEFEVGNYGDGPWAYGVMLVVELVKKNRTIEFSDVFIEQIKHEESKKVNVYFSEIKDASDYDYINVSIDWKDSENNEFSDL